MGICVIYSLWTYVKTHEYVCMIKMLGYLGNINRDMTKCINAWILRRYVFDVCLEDHLWIK